jgi:CBS domain-containing protein
VRCPACDADNIPGEDLCQGCGMDLAGLDVAAWDLDPRDPLLARPLAELPLKDPIVLAPDASVSEAIEAMRRRGEGCVFVVDAEGRLAGIVTEHDVTARVAVPARDPERTRLDKIMTAGPVALQRSDPLAWALHRMGVDGYRHVPVLDAGRLIGFLSIRTVLRALHEA